MKCFVVFSEFEIQRNEHAHFLEGTPKLDDVRKDIYSVVEGFLRNTKRIVSVVVYATVVLELAEQKMMLMRHRFNEFLNASHRFDATKSWALFKDYKVPEEWGGMHPKWVRVFSQGFIMRQK